jgi:cobalamin biosynthesis protein CobT
MVEKGTHQELLALNGRYAAMWEKHCRAERAAEHARDATRKAKKLLCQAKISRRDEISDGYSSMVSSAILPPRQNRPTSDGSSSDSSSDSSSSKSESEKSDSESISSRESRHGSEHGSEHTLRDEGGEESRHEEMADDEYSPGDEAEEPLLSRMDNQRPSADSTSLNRP